jgi:voltage-gated potassium channel
MKKLRPILYRILETNSGPYRRYGRWFTLALISLISLNALAILLHTVPKINAGYSRLFLDFEVFSVVLFTIEYAVRLWVCVEDERYRHPVRGRLRYALTAPALIHLLAILPFYLSHFNADLSLIRLLRLFQMVRLFRLTRYSRALTVIREVLVERKEELVLSVLFILFVLLISSSVMYYLEHDGNPRDFSSIPATLWWGVATMTTVGYGDVVPQTPWGKVIGGIVALTGVGLVALPTGILASGFAQAMSRNRGTKRHVCPHCGREFHEV